MKKFIILALLPILFGCSKSSNNQLSISNIQEAINNTPTAYNDIAEASCLRTRFTDLTLCPVSFFDRAGGANGREAIEIGNKEALADFSKNIELVGNCKQELYSKKQIGKGYVESIKDDTNEIELEDNSYISYTCPIKVKNLATDSETQEFISRISPSLEQTYGNKKLITPKYFIRDIVITNTNNSWKVLGMYIGQREL